jgi:Fe2+ or Zn2+ uptake regulation protein
MYENFIRANPDLKSRVEALISILSPDTQGIALLSMDSNKAYTYGELYNQTLKFCDIEKFPVNRETIGRYCKFLASIGAVDSKEKEKWRLKYYQKTDAGRDFGDPLVAIGTYVVNELLRMNVKYRSLNKILGQAGYRRYRIIKLLAENSESKFTWSEILNELKEFGGETISTDLNKLGEAGIIFYSPRKNAKDWARYELKNKFNDEEEIISKAKELKPFVKEEYLQSVINHIKQHPDDIFEHNKLSSILKIRSFYVRECLSILSELGYLSEFKVKGGHSTVKANKITEMLFRELFEPIERIAYKLDPNDSEFRKRLEDYQAYPDKWKNAIKNQLEIYSREI